MKKRLFFLGTAAIFALAVLTMCRSANNNLAIPANLTAADLIGRMTVGWNLGNTFDSHNSRSSAGYALDAPLTTLETMWIGGESSLTTQSLIQQVSAQGFKTIRIPVTWYKAADPDNNYAIRPDYMERVKQVVDWAIEENMFVVLNMHHDNIMYNLNEGDASLPTHSGNRYVTSVWKQIAETFRDYNEKLIFAILNEPRTYGTGVEWSGGTELERPNLNHLNQAMLNTIRATGGNNINRIIQMTTIAASPSDNAINGFRVPLDLEQHRVYMGNSTNVGIGETNISSKKIIFQIQAYAPHGWAHDGRGEYNFSDIVTVLNRVQARAAELGLPVNLSEWGSIESVMPVAARTDENVAARPALRVQHAEAFVREARARGMMTIWWDCHIFEGTNPRAHTFGLIRRAYPHVIEPQYQDIINAIMRGAGVANQR